MKPLYSEGNIQYNYPYSHDPDEKKYYTFSYRPAVWTADTEVVKGVDVIVAPTSNGMLYECTSGGITGSVAPTFGTLEKGTTADNSAVWTAKPLTLMLADGDTITLSTWSVPTDTTFDNDSIVSGIATKLRLTAVPTDAEEVTITNTVTVTRVNGDVEEFDRSIIIRITEL